MSTALPTFCTSQMVENRWPGEAFLAHLPLFRLSTLWIGFWGAVVFVFCLWDFFCSTVFVVKAWRKWLIVAKLLIEKKLARSSLTSWQTLLLHFVIPELSNRVWQNWQDWPFPFLVRVQNRVVGLLLSLLLKLNLLQPAEVTAEVSAGSLPRIAQEWEQLDELVNETLHTHLISPLIKITKEYEAPPHKIDLQTVDLEDYFNFSGTIDLRLVDGGGYDDHRHLRIFNRNDRLLVTIPTSVISKICDHTNDCSCTTLWILKKQKLEPESMESVEPTKFAKLQLMKNFFFLDLLWNKLRSRKPEEIRVPDYGHTRFFARTELEMPWKNSMKDEFTIATFVVTDIVFSPTMREVKCAGLQFVGIE